MTAEKRQKRVRGKIKRWGGRVRLSVFRSNKFIYAQIIDDKEGKTLVSAGPLEVAKLHSRSKLKDNKQNLAMATGELLAKKAIEKGIKEVAFDRGSYLYHGRVKALAEGARKGGLKF